jgi:hypothetical protein
VAISGTIVCGLRIVLFLVGGNSNQNMISTMLLLRIRRRLLLG